MRLRQRIISGITAISILSSALFPAVTVFSEEMPTETAATAAPETATSDGNTSEMSVTTTGEVLSVTGSETSSAVTAANSEETSAPESTAPADESAASTAVTEETKAAEEDAETDAPDAFSFSGSGADISLTVENGVYALPSDAVMAKDDVSFFAYGISVDDYTYPMDIDRRVKVLRGYSILFNCGTERVTVISDSVKVKYTFTEELPEEYADSVAVYTVQNGQWVQAETGSPVTENGLVKSVSFDASLPSLDMFCVVWTDPASVKPDESILSSDRVYGCEAEGISAEATAFAGAVCTGGEDPVYGALPENANNISFTLDRLSEDDESYALFGIPSETERLSVYRTRFYSEKNENVSVSDYETAVDYALSEPVPEEFAFTLKAYAHNGSEKTELAFETVTENGLVTALTFTADEELFAVSEPVKTAAESIAEYSDEVLDISHIIPAGALVTAGGNTVKPSDISVSGHIMSEEEISLLPVIEGYEDKDSRYISLDITSGTEKALISEHSSHITYKLPADEKLMADGAVLLRLDEDGWTENGISSTCSSEGILQTLSFTDNGSAAFVLLADGLKEPAEPRFFEYKDEQLSVNVEVGAEAAFTDENSEEVSADDVRLYAKEITEPVDIEIGADERMKLYDIGFVTSDGTAVSADILSSHIDFTVQGEAGETISNIEIFEIGEENTAAPVEILTTEEPADVIPESTISPLSLSSEAAGPQETVSVDDDKLSTYAVKYTVDFKLGDFEYSMNGGSEVLLSEMLSSLGVEEDIKGSTVEFTNEELLSFEKIEEETAEGRIVTDWRILSLRPFSTEEMLTVRLANGANIEIAVTDNIEQVLGVGCQYYFRDLLDWMSVTGGHDINIDSIGRPSFRYQDGTTVGEDVVKITPITGTDKDGNNFTRDYKVEIKNTTDTSTLQGLTIHDKNGDQLKVKDGVLSAEGSPVIYDFVQPHQNVDMNSLFFELINGVNEDIDGDGKNDTWKADTSKKGHSFEYELYYNVSGNESIAPGKMNIIIPLHILKDSSGKYADEIELSIPDQQTYDDTKNISLATSKIYFTYTIDSANNVVRITNVKPIEGGNNPTIVFAYKTTDSSYNYEDEVFSEPAFANIRIDTTYGQAGSEKDVKVSDITKELPVAIDTDVDLTKTEKSISSADIYQSWNNSWGTAPADADDYVYMVWKVRNEFRSYDVKGSPIEEITQKYSFGLTQDDIYAVRTNDNGTETLIEGEVIKAYLSGINEWKDWNGSGEMTLSDTEQKKLSGLVDRGRTDHVLVRYKKSDVNLYIKDQVTDKVTDSLKVTFNNTVDDKMTPEGKSLEEPGTASGKIDYKAPIYQPPKDELIFKKEGRYAGNQTVSNQSHISFYTLQKLKEDRQDIKGLKYYVYGTASMLPETFNGIDPTDEKEVGYYQKKSVKYELTDDRSIEPLVLTDLKSGEKYQLSDDDYYFSNIDYDLAIHKGEYSNNEKVFVKAAFTPEDKAPAEMELWVRVKDSSDFVQIGTYDAKTQTMIPTEAADPYVKNISSYGVVFKEDANVVGYRFKSENCYYITSVTAYPYVTLKATESVRSTISDKDAGDDSYLKIQLDNTAEFRVVRDDTEHTSARATGKTYVAEEMRSSFISKTVNTNTSSDENQVMNHLYKVPWKVEMSEKIKTEDNIEQYVYQQSGKFYDLLPITSTARVEGIKVYAGNEDGSMTLLNEGDYIYSVNERRHDSSKNMDRVLLTVDIDKGAYFYVLEIITVHTYEDILTYGRSLINSAAYETGNEDIYGGFPDNGGNLTEKNLMRDLDPDTDDRKFLYSQAKWYIQALISNLIGLRKQVSSKRDLIPTNNAIVGPDEVYTYTYRQKNGNTDQKNIVFMDAVENLTGTFNDASRYTLDREWRGEPVAFRFGNLIGGLKIKPVLYVNENDVDFTSSSYAPARDPGNGSVLNTPEGKTYAEEFISYVMNQNLGWKRLNGVTDANGDTTWYTEDDKPYDLAKMKAFMLDLSKKQDGTEFILPANGTMTFSLDMRSPAKGMIDKEGYNCEDIRTYNNIFISYDSMATDGSGNFQSSYIHQDYTTVTYRVIGDVRLRKTNSDTQKPIAGILFHLSGTSDYGDVVDKYMTTNSAGEITFSGVEKGTYTLIEENQSPDYQVVGAMTVTVDEDGTASISPSDGTFVFDLYLNMRNGTTVKGTGDLVFQLFKGSELISTQTQPLLPGTGTFVFKDIPIPERDETYTLREFYKSTSSTSEYTIKSVGDNSIVWDISDDDTSNDDTYSHKEGNLERYYRITRKVYSVLNKPRIHGDLVFAKKDSTNLDKNADGAVFELTTVGNGDNDTTKYGLKIPDEEKGISQLTAKSVGGKVTFANIELGRYVMREITYPDGYAPVSKTYYVEVTAAADNSAIIKMYTDDTYETEVTEKSGDLYIVKNDKTVDFTVLKTDNVNTSEYLYGAVFTLTPTEETLAKLDAAKLNSNVWVGENHVQTVKSQVTGYAEFKDLAPDGEYVLKEITAPANHNLQGAKDYTVKVSDNGELTITDTSGNALTPIAEGDYAGLYRITNNRVYEQNVTVVKKWVGNPNMNGETPVFPELILDTKEQALTRKVATISSTFSNYFTSGVQNFVRLDLTGSYGSKEEAENTVGVTLNDITDKSSSGTFFDVDGNTVEYNCANEKGHVYIGTDGNTVYFWSDSSEIYLPSNSSSLFENATSLTKVDLNRILPDRVTTMENMFMGCGNLSEIDFGSNFVNGMNVQTTKSMFEGCTSVESIDLSDFCTGTSLSNTNRMFYMSNRDFLQNSQFEITTISGVKRCTIKPVSSLKNLNLDNFQTSSVKNMEQMFYNCDVLKVLNIDPNHFKANSALESVKEMFFGCCALEYADLRGFENCCNLTSATDWFNHCYFLEFVDLSNFIPNTALTADATMRMFAHCGTGYDGESHTINSEQGYYFNNSQVVGLSVFAIENWNLNFKTPANKNKYDYYWRNEFYDGIVIKEYQNTGHTSGDSFRLKQLDWKSYKSNNNPQPGFKPKGDTGYFLSTEWTDDNGVNFYEKLVKEIAGDDYLTKYSASNTNVNSNINRLNALSVPQFLRSESETSPALTITYMTEKTGTPKEGTENVYEVNETVTLSTGETMTLTATWELVSTNQWVCTLQVYNPLDKYYVVEDDIYGYVSDAFKSKLSDEFKGKEMTAGITTITNRKEEVEEPKYGHLKIEKHLLGVYGTHVEKSKLDRFTFKVTLKKNDGGNFTNNEYFSFSRHWIDENTRTATEYPGARLFRVNEDDPTELIGYCYLVENGWIEFTDIPVEWTYKIEEVGDSNTQYDLYDPDDPNTPKERSDDLKIIGYTSQGAWDGTGGLKDIGSYSTANADGTIVEYVSTEEIPAVQYVLWGNTVDRKSLILTKEATHKVIDSTGVSTETPLTESEQNTEFIYNIHLENLLIYGSTISEHDNKGYPYPIKVFDKGQPIQPWKDIYLSGSINTESELVQYELGEDETAGYRDSGEFKDKGYIIRAKPDGTADFKVKLRPGQTLRVYNLPYGVEYTATEEKNGNWKLEGVSVKAVNPDDTDYLSVPQSFTDGQGSFDGTDTYKGMITDDLAVPHLTFNNLLETEKTVQLKVRKRWTSGTGTEEKDITELTPPQNYDDMEDINVNLVREYYISELSQDRTTLADVTLGKDNDWKTEFTDLPARNSDNIRYNYYVTETPDDQKETYYTTSAKFMDGTTETAITSVYRDGKNTITIGDDVYTISNTGTATLYLDPDNTGQVTVVDGSGKQFLTSQQGETVIIDYAEYPIGSGRFVKNNGNGTPLFTLYSSQYETGDEKAVFVGDAEGNTDFEITNRIKQTYDVYLKKEVKGTLGDKSQAYDFTVSLLKDGSYWQPTSGLKVKIDDGEPEDRLFTFGEEVISLTHGQKAVICGIPEEDIKVVIEEREYRNYTTESSKMTEGSDFKTDELEGSRTQTVDKLESDVYIYYRNTMDVTVPTGTKLPKVSAVFAGFLALGVLLLAGREKSRLTVKRKDDEEV